MTNLIDTVIEQYTNDTEFFSTKKDGWYQDDSMAFLRQKKLQQEIRFCEFWIPSQQRRYDTAKRWVSHWLRRRNGDEISENNYQGSLAHANAEHYNVEFLQGQLDTAQLAYKEEFGEVYTTVADSNVAPDGTPPEIDEKTRLELAAHGISPDGTSVA